MLKICTRLWRKAHSEVKMLKNWRVWTAFVSSDVEKMHAAVAKSTFGSENVKKLTSSEHFLKFWCRKLWSNSEVKMCKMYKTWRVWTTSVRAHVEKMHAAVAEVKMLKNWRPRSTFWSSDVESSGAILKSKCTKCTKHDVFGPLLYVLMLKKCTPLWRKAHLEVK